MGVPPRMLPTMDYLLHNYVFDSTGMKLTVKQIRLFEKPQHDKFNDTLTNELLHYSSTMLSECFGLLL